MADRAIIIIRQIGLTFHRPPSFCVLPKCGSGVRTFKLTNARLISALER